MIIAGSIFDPIYQTLGTVLAAFYAVVPSFGLAIALLTVAVRVAMIPLTAKQVRSQQAMQRLQPQIKALQAKHKGDRQKLNEETMKFYKEHNFNPLSGCLPVLLQAPLFIVLYRLINDLSARPPRHLPIGSSIYRALLESGGSMPSWGMDLARSAKQAQGFIEAVPFYLLITLVVVTGFFQARQMAARMPKDGINAQMQIIGKVFPAFMGLISLSIPAGVVVYFVVSNLWQIGQQAVTFRGQPLPGAGSAPVKTDDKAPDDKAPNGKAPDDKSGNGKSVNGKSPGKAAAGNAQRRSQAKPDSAKNRTPAKGKPTPAKNASRGTNKVGKSKPARTGTGKARQSPSTRPPGVPGEPRRDS